MTSIANESSSTAEASTGATADAGALRPWIASCASALVVSVIAFVVIFGAAAGAYPGGTHFDHAAAGHDFWRNTLCDVARGVALDGQANPAGCALARVAMTILALGVGVLFALLPELFPSRERTGVAVRVLGTFAVAGAIAVVFLPTDRFSAMHAVAVTMAGFPGLAASLLAVHALVRDSRASRLVAAVGVLALVVAALDFGLFVSELVAGGRAQVSVSVLERVATILVLAWMLVVARDAALRRSDGSKPQRP